MLNEHNQIELNGKLVQACLEKTVDYSKVEGLLKQGAKPLGKVVCDWGYDNVYAIVVDELFKNEHTEEDFYLITEMFLRYGMDISNPDIPYDNDNILNPMFDFSFYSNEVVLRTLKLLLDHGLSAEDAAYVWAKALSDYIHLWGSLDDRFAYEMYYDFIRKMMLIASYPHILEEEEYLQRDICLSENHYDLKNFRNWDRFEFDVDVSPCGQHPHVIGSIVTICEKEKKEAVWRFQIWCYGISEC